MGNISLCDSWLKNSAEKSGHTTLLKILDDLSGLSKLVEKILMIVRSIVILYAELSCRNLEYAIIVSVLLLLSSCHNF